MSSVNRMCSPREAVAADIAPQGKRLDPLVRYIIVNWALGALAGLVCASALLLIDPFGLVPLLWRSDVAVAALLMLYSGFMTTFGGLVCAAAVMFPPNEDDPPRGGLRGKVTPEIAFVGIPVRRSLAG